MKDRKKNTALDFNARWDGGVQERTQAKLGETA